MSNCCQQNKNCRELPIEVLPGKGPWSTEKEMTVYDGTVN